MNKQLNSLIERELSRKDFLKFVGGGVVALLGMHNLISYIAQYSRTSTPPKPAETHHGFGSRKFGV